MPCKKSSYPAANITWRYNRKVACRGLETREKGDRETEKKREEEKRGGGGGGKEGGNEGMRE